MALEKLTFTKDWTRPEDFPAYEADETQVRADMQRLHDEAKSYLNDVLIPHLEELGVEHILQIPTDAGMMYIRLNADKVLETSEDGLFWEATGSSGHLIVDDRNNVLPQRSRLKFENGIVSDNGTETVIKALKGDKGDKGDRGEQGPQFQMHPAPAGASAEVQAP